MSIAKATSSDDRRPAPPPSTHERAAAPGHDAPARTATPDEQSATTDPAVTLNPILEEILRTQEVWLDDGQRLPLHSHVSLEQGALLQRLVRELDARITLEVGLGYGISAMFICDALAPRPGARHFCMDPKQGGHWWQDLGLRNLERAGYGDLIDFRRMTSAEALPQIRAEGHALDLALIDGWHTFDHTLVDFFHIDTMLKVGGVVVFDDCQWPSVEKACRYVAANRSYRVIAALPPRRPLRHQALRRMLAAAADRSRFLRKLLRIELARPDDALGWPFGSRCIALRKEADDDRECFAHDPF